MKSVLKSSLVLAAVMLLAGCGGTAKQEVVREDPHPRTVSYKMYEPANMQVMTTRHPTYVFERDTNGADAQSLCTGTGNNRIGRSEIRVVKLDPATGVVVESFTQHVSASDDCRVEASLVNPVLEENATYAWQVVNPNGDMPWHTFVYAPGVIADAEDPHSCEKNLIANWSFLNRPAPWQGTNMATFTPVVSAAIVSDGDGDSNSAQIASPDTILMQQLQAPIEQGKYYRLRFRLKHLGKADFQIKALAFNGTLDSIMPDANISVIGMSGTMTNPNQWISVTLAPWHANHDFESLAIVLLNDENKTINARIDRVCLVEVDATAGCGESVENPGTLPDGVDLANNDEVTVTTFEYLNGTVSDLYPDYNTSTVGWYDDALGEGALSCVSVGGDVTDEDSDEMDSEMNTPELDAALDELNTTGANVIEDIAASDTNSTDLLPIVPRHTDKCSHTVQGDPNKPFYGRDIVYVHGLQLPALKGNLKQPPTYQEKWPADSARFYTGGDIINRAKSYWAQHIERELGSLTNPSNSYLVVSWSANQRLRYGIHAVLTQIRDALVNDNPNIVFSQRAKDMDQCFGTNGIVMITHSTGGLLTSSLFGIAEHSNDPNAEIRNYGATVNIKDTYGDVRFITDKIHAQIGFNSAYSGTKFASTALQAVHVLSQNLNSPNGVALQNIIKQFFHFQLPPSYSTLEQTLQNSLLVDLSPAVSMHRWVPWEGASTIPTLTTTGTTLGKPTESTPIGKKIIKGYDDTVLSPSCQAGRTDPYNKRYYAKRKHMKDKGIGKKRRKETLKDARAGHGRFTGNGTRVRNYYNTPHVFPSGMVAGDSFAGHIDYPSQSQYIPNHYLVLQNTGTHYDNVNTIHHLNSGIALGNNYEWTVGTINGATLQIWPPVTFTHADDERNYEETGVVIDPTVYSRGWLSPRFADLNDEWIRKEAWGLHLPALRWRVQSFHLFGRTVWLRVPYIIWVYKEFVKWKRTYHLLHDYENKKGADYMYDYVLRP